MAASIRHRSLASRPKPASSAQVIVVGAGLSGLQTAYELQQAGISCLVLEAQERLGGRLRSVPCAGGKGVADFGGAWIDAVHQPRATALVRQLGIEMVSEHSEGEAVMQGAGRFKYGEVPPFDEEDQRSYARVLDNIEGLSQRVDLNNPTAMLPNYGSMTVLDLVRAHGATFTIQRLASAWTSTLFGVAADSISALYFLLCVKTAGGLRTALDTSPRGSRRLRFRRGAQELVGALAEELVPGSVMLGQAVRWVDRTSGDRVVLTTESGEVFQCERVVLAVPTSGYADIEFSPALGEEKECLQTGERQGFYGEVVMVFDKPWWRDAGLSGLTQSVEGPVWETRDSSNDIDGVYSLTCVVAGESGRGLFSVCRCQRRQRIINHLTSLLGELPSPPLEMLETNWAEDGDFSRHVPCPAVLAEHLNSGGAEDQWAAEGSVHFVGAEASHVWRGHVEGALAAGSRGAAEVVMALRPVEEELLAPRL